MRGQEIVAPSKRQRWGAILVALVVAGVVVTRGGTPESTQADAPQLWHEDIESVVVDPAQWLESETGEVDGNDPAAASRSK